MLFNAFYDYALTHSAAVYLGCDLGVAHNDIKGVFNLTQSCSDTQYEFTWDFGIGLSPHLCHHLALDIDYRYTDLGQAD